MGKAVNNRHSNRKIAAIYIYEEYGVKKHEISERLFLSETVISSMFLGKS